MNGRTSAILTPEELRRHASRIKVILMDVDGCLTDGKLYYVPGADGSMVETKGFDTQDGLGLHLCYQAGIVTGVISGRLSPATDERCRILNMKYVYQGLLDKIATYEHILADAGVSAEETVFIGDDFTDVPLMQRAGLGVAVANARAEVKEAANYITQCRGGDGAVREVVELVLQARGLWDGVLKKYFAAAVVG